MSSLRSKLYKQLIKPKTVHPDKQRREFIFNVLIGLFTVAASLTLLSSSINHLLGNAPDDVNSIPVTLGFLVITSGLWWLSRKGRYQFGAYVLSGLLLLCSWQLVLFWSFELPMAQLVNVLVIAVVGVVLSSTAAWLVTLIIAFSTLGIGYLQVHGLLTPNTQWMNGPLEYSDAVGQVVIYIIIGSVLWLSNREIDRLLRRSWRSEKALAKERDQLEVTVAKRTRELEQAQMTRVLELQQFAEFGRVSAHLLHDLANPLTAAALNLEEAGNRRGSKFVSEALVSLAHIERYITTARKQLQGADHKRRFQPSKEIADLVELLRNQAASARVKLKLELTTDKLLYGDVAAFHRVIANIIVNAIQSYQSKKTTTQAVVAITMTDDSEQVSIVIQDTGVGIKAADLPHIFDDFYSTKKHVGRGLGLGLASAKQVIEQGFSGSIEVVSKPRGGTIFTIRIPLHEASNQSKRSSRA